MEITTTAFENGKYIPVKHTCDGDDTSPPLRWDKVPKGTVTFALLVEDPDAPGGTFAHWIMYNIPADVQQLEAIIPVAKNLDNGAIHGKNDFGKYGYRGPCPPDQDDAHKYFFRIFALDKKLAPEQAANRQSLLNAVKNHVIDEGEYLGLYKRQ